VAIEGYFIMAALIEPESTMPDVAHRVVAPSTQMASVSVVDEVALII
jgi:hypothetical protein